MESIAKSSLVKNFGLLALPITVFGILNYFFPMAGMTNNGNCDAWYYWGMGNSSTVASSTIGINYYPGSRILMYAPGWLLPDFLNYVLWSKIFSFLPYLFLTIAIFLTFKGKSREKILVANLIICLLPISVSQASANYAATTLALVLFLASLSIYGQEGVKKQIFTGLVLSAIFFTNPEGILIALPIYVVSFLRARSHAIRNTFLNLIGATIMFFTLSLMMFSQTSTRKFTFTFLKPQILAMIDSLKSPDVYFTTSIDRFWFVVSPVPIFLLGIAMILAVIALKECRLSIPAIYGLSSIATLFIFQIVGIGNTFSESFNSLAAVWIGVIPLIEVFNRNEYKFKTLIKLTLFALIGCYLVFLLIMSNRLFFSLDEMLTYHLLMPSFILLATITFIQFQGTNTLKISPYLVTFLLVFSSMSISDYSSAFYQSENTPFKASMKEFTSEYKAAQSGIDMVVNDFPTSTIGGVSVEDPNNGRQVKYVRAAARAFASCGRPWSRFSSQDSQKTIVTEEWPEVLMVASSTNYNTMNLGLGTSYILIKESKVALVGENIKISVLKRLHISH
jgi:hypothetical protein